MFIIGKLTYFLRDFSSWIILYTAVISALTYFGFRFAKSAKRKKAALLANLTLSAWITLFSLLHLIVGFELYFRYVFDQTDNVFQIQTTKQWERRHVAPNSFGYRDELFFPDKDPKETRIAVVGDSFTWGYGINNPANRYSDLLQKSLSNRCGEPDRIKLYTLAQPGRNTRDHLKALKEMGGINRPDFDAVIMGYYMDDASSAQSVRHFQHCYQRVFSYRRRPILKSIIDNSYSLQYLWVRIYNRFIFPDYAQTCWDNNYAALYQDPEVRSRHLLELDEFINYTHDQQIEMAVIIFPFMNLIGPDYPAAIPAQRLTDFFQSQNVPVVNLAPLLSGFTPNQVMVNPRDFHANEMVNQLVADKLFEAVKDLDSFACKI